MVGYPAGYPVLSAGYPAGYRIAKKAGYPAGYPASRISGTTLVQSGRENMDKPRKAFKTTKTKFRALGSNSPKKMARKKFLNKNYTEKN